MYYWKGCLDSLDFLVVFFFSFFVMSYVGIVFKEFFGFGDLECGVWIFKFKYVIG